MATIETRLSARILSLIVNGTSAENVNATYKFVVGVRYNPETGKESPAFASFRGTKETPMPFFGTAEALRTFLRSSDCPTTIKLSVPSIGIGGKLELSLRPIYTGSNLADLLERLDSGEAGGYKTVAERLAQEEAAAQPTVNTDPTDASAPPAESNRTNGKRSKGAAQHASNGSAS